MLTTYGCDGQVRCSQTFGQISMKVNLTVKISPNKTLFCYRADYASSQKIY